ncbi:RodZ domain-containing protein [Larsenimonas rhizosphaerae]|uniref:DUF4115 domain-containing protein n=1 Tax=Larsenimonas rhizosphaerae TaxID=2944682 RepID=A0AA41ZFZ3_9GAMM|nr:RodZ domain-containing protein [Larsenimonas rhizosphaerae]MCX2524559.1 DUF4115 domain-containing protein [Larsenimonas rhizosphaerae]
MTERHDTPIQDTLHMPGTLLKAERERQGLSVDTVARKLNLKPSLVDDFERNQFDKVQIAAYRRGYLRSYARLLHMDEAIIVDAHDRQFGREDASTPRAAPIQTIKPRSGRPGRLGRIVFRLFTLLVIAVLAGLTLVWWQSRDNTPDVTDDGVDTTALPASESITQIPTPIEIPDTTAQVSPTPEQQDTAPTTEPATPAIEETAPSTPEVADSATPDTSSAPVATDADTAVPTLAMSFAQDSWVRITDSSGKNVISGLQTAGTTAQAEGTPPFRLTIGNASHVTLRLNGEQVNLAPHTRSNNVAKFTLNQ